MRLAAEGAKVGVLDLADSAETLRKVDGAGGEAHAVQCEVADDDAVVSAVAEVRERFGAPGIPVHCAAYQMRAPFAELTAEQWRRAMAVNVDDAFHLVRAVVPGMEAAGWGRIVLVGSSSFFAPPSGKAAGGARRPGGGAVVPRLRRRGVHQRQTLLVDGGEGHA